MAQALELKVAALTVNVIDTGTVTGVFMLLSPLSFRLELLVTINVILEAGNYSCNYCLLLTTRRYYEYFFH